MSKDLYNALKEGVVTVEFIKIDTGELRVMPCTLNQEIHKQTLNIKNYSTNDTMVMYGLDVKAFPEIYLFPALNKDRAVPYDGPRNVRDIHKFLQEKVSYMFTLKKNDGDDNERAKDVGGGGHDEL